MNVNADECVDENYPSLWGLFWTFLKIGSTAFGGFMALISVVQNYLVDREKLLSDEDMLDGISLATILPGPVAVNVVAYAGYKIRGISGAIVCATAVILPSFFLILFLSYAYFTWGDMPAVNNVFQGVLPAVAAVIASTAFKMAQKTLTGVSEKMIGVMAIVVLIAIGGFYSTLAIILCAGLIGFLLYKNADASAAESVKEKNNPEESKTSSKKFLIPLFILVFLVALVAILPLVNTDTFLVGKLLATFSGMSVLLFGGGFVFIPLMQESVVETYQWVTHQEFIDAIAMGQITPGPILISATFIGYKVAGVLGAATATIGIFTPPAMIMLVCTHYLQSLKKSQNLKAVLKGVRCGVIGMIAAAAYFVAISTELNVISGVLFVLAMIALLKFKLEVVWVIPVSGIIGLVAFA